MDQGKSIIFITHKLKEVLTIADRVIVLRNGRVVGETTPAESSEEELAEMMVGREVTSDRGQGTGLSRGRGAGGDRAGGG